MAIRKMNFSDLDQVIQLYQDANLFAKIKDIRDWTRDGLEGYPEFNFVYEQNEKIIGAISLSYHGLLALLISLKNTSAGYK